MAYNCTRGQQRDLPAWPAVLSLLALAQLLMHTRGPEGGLALK